MPASERRRILLCRNPLSHGLQSSKKGDKTNVEATNDQRSKGSRPPIPRSLQVCVYRRDHWLCRWCKRPVVFAPALKYLQEELANAGFKNLAYWRYAYDRSGAPLLDELAAVVDHVKAFSAGGAADIENLTTACNRCNMRKNSGDAEKWEREHPIKPIRSRHGEPEDWDGFSSVFAYFANHSPSKLTSTEKEWLEALCKPCPSS